MPIKLSSGLIAVSTTAVLCLGPAMAAPAQASVHHKSHHAKKGKRLSRATARAVALKSATPLILDPADQVRVTGCRSVAGRGYSCALTLHPATSASVCHWTVVVAMAQGVPDVVSYSHIDCAG